MATYPQAVLYKSAEAIGARYEPSASAAMRELESLSGETVLVKSPYGGSRSDAEGRAINQYLSPRSSDHNFRKGRALDVDNRGAIITGIARRQGLTFTQATTRYYAVWAKHGWHNMQINGQPFPAEPWHMANHSSTPQGTGGVPIGGSTSKPIYQEAPMTTLATVPASVAAGKPTFKFDVGVVTNIDAATLGVLRTSSPGTVRVDLKDRAAVVDLMRVYQLDEYSVEDLLAVSGTTTAYKEGSLRASWLTSAAVALTSEQLAELAAHLAPLLGGITDADLAAAVSQIKTAIPTTFTAG